jgi:hypothetical protein
LTYTWAATAIPTGAPTPTFSDNGTNDAKNDVATFYQAGTYTFTVTITNAAGYSTTSSVDVVVNQALSGFDLMPASAVISEGGSQQFSATAFDQFGQPLETQPTFTWTIIPGGLGGTISSTGLYTAPPTGAGSDMFTVSTGSFSTTATVEVTSQASVASVSVAWGAAGTADLFTGPDGLLLLPAGRNTDLPWLNINQIEIRLDQPAQLAPGDVSVIGATGTNYGPVTIIPTSDALTSYTIILAQPIADADRVTISIGNAQIAPFTRRLDVLPGDVNDDGVVSSADVTGALDLEGTPDLFADVNGDGFVSTADLETIRNRNGSTLLPPAS